MSNLLKKLDEVEDRREIQAILKAAHEKLKKLKAKNESRVPDKVINEFAKELAPLFKGQFKEYSFDGGGLKLSIKYCIYWEEDNYSTLDILNFNLTAKSKDVNAKSIAKALNSVFNKCDVINLSKEFLVDLPFVRKEMNAFTKKIREMIAKIAKAEKTYDVEENYIFEKASYQVKIG